MSYLKFDRRLIANLDESLQREQLRTNRMGAYSCSTIVGCNTRKYHGMLVVPIPELSPNNHVLLSSLDLTIIQHEAPFNIGIHEYQGDVFSPKGHKYIREYNIDVSPYTIYRVGGVIMRREQIFCHFSHRLIIKYSLLEAHSVTELNFTPFLAFRDVKILTHRNEHIRNEYTTVQNGIGICLYEGYPNLYMQFSNGVGYESAPHWNERIEYIKERERGYEYTEDLYVPGYFRCTITKNKPIYFTAGLEEIDPEELEKLFESEQKSRIPKTDFRHCLYNAAQQFYYRPTPTDGYLLAGYPWFGVRARDMMVALPGCTLYCNAPERFERIMNTLMPIFTAYLHQEEMTTKVQNLSDPDIGLWIIRAIQLYAQWSGNAEETRKRYGNLVWQIIQYYRRNIHPRIRMTENKLLFAKGDGRPLTWMDAKLNGKAVVQREGYIVEVNALWYNALCFMGGLYPDEWEKDLKALAQEVQKSFTDTFYNEHDYLFDYVMPDAPRDQSVRPNMIFAVSLPHSPLTRRQQRNILDIVTRELRTPKGLRTLSPKSEGFRGVCGPSQYERELSYYNGSAWPWLLGAYCEAYLKINGRGGIAFVERILIGMEEELQQHGIGTISELFDGNPPYMGRGAISFAMSVGEITRALCLLDEAKTEISNPIIRYL